MRNYRTTLISKTSANVLATNLAKAAASADESKIDPNTIVKLDSQDQLPLNIGTKTIVNKLSLPQ